MNEILFNGVIFREIPGVSGYFVSMDGIVISTREGPSGKHGIHYKSAAPDSDGYLRFSQKVSKNRTYMTVHHAVLLTWVGPRQGNAQCRHLNGVKTDNRAVNLKWGSSGENGDDKRIHKSSAGIRNGAARMTEEFVIRLREERKTSRTGALVRKYSGKFSKFAIWAAISGYTWAHLPGAFQQRRTCFKGSSPSQLKKV